LLLGAGHLPSIPMIARRLRDVICPFGPNSCNQTERKLPARMGCHHFRGENIANNASI
jgi:hypothetical protein